jgi:RNA polymerase sigma factor (sigma-70 family)
MGPLHHQLREAELADLIVAAQSDEHDDSPAMNEIICRFDNKARGIAAAVCLRAADRDDVANAARIALVRAVRGHDVAREGFATYAITFMTGAARRESKRLACPQETYVESADLAAAIDDPKRCQIAGRTAACQDWSPGRISKIVASLPPRQRELLDVRYLQDFDLVRIAQLHGSSVSAVSQRLKTAHKHINRQMRRTATATMAA